jgi:hypothetical protein
VLRFVVVGLRGGVEVDDGVGIGAAVSSVEPTRAGKSDLTTTIVQTHVTSLGSYSTTLGLRLILMV